MIKKLGICGSLNNSKVYFMLSFKLSKSALKRKLNKIAQEMGLLYNSRGDIKCI